MPTALRTTGEPGKRNEKPKWTREMRGVIHLMFTLWLNFRTGAHYHANLRNVPTQVKLAAWRIFIRIFPHMADHYGWGNMYDKWTVRMDLAQSKDWIVLDRPNRCNMTPYTPAEMAEFAEWQKMIEDAARALSIQLHPVTNYLTTVSNFTPAQATAAAQSQPDKVISLFAAENRTGQFAPEPAADAPASLAPTAATPAASNTTNIQSSSQSLRGSVPPISTTSSSTQPALPAAQALCQPSSAAPVSAGENVEADAPQLAPVDKGKKRAADQTFDMPSAKKNKQAGISNDEGPAVKKNESRHVTAEDDQLEVGDAQLDDALVERFGGPGYGFQFDLPNDRDVDYFGYPSDNAKDAETVQEDETLETPQGNVAPPPLLQLPMQHTRNHNNVPPTTALYQYGGEVVASYTTTGKITHMVCNPAVCRDCLPPLPRPQLGDSPTAGRPFVHARHLIEKLDYIQYDTEEEIKTFTFDREAGISTERDVPRNVKVANVLFGGEVVECAVCDLAYCVGCFQVLRELDGVEEVDENQDE